jgi:hypothetical protein
MPLKGIYGKPYIDLSPYINLENFDKLHPSICKGLVEAKDHAFVGSMDVPDDFIKLKFYKEKFTPLSQAYKSYSNLSNADPIKAYGSKFEGNNLAFYLKYALGGYDLYTFYLLNDFTKDWKRSTEILGKTDCYDYFSEFNNWVQNLQKQNIFSHIGRVLFFVQEAGGISLEHSDDYLDLENESGISEFIHIQSTLDRKFYVRDNDTGEKFYLSSRVSYFNDKDIHGGDPVLKPTYAIRIDGVFTDYFRKLICQ